ncbi:hypothetical protein C9426_14590 [Serratia sp. S1B]|nr:hypothetical protein C9426_14590 [Serratia sp. S1B]
MKKISALIIMMLTSLPGIASEKSNVIKPSALINIKNNSEQYNAICNGIKNICVNDTKVWRNKDEKDIFYLTTPSLDFIKIRKNNNSYTQEMVWRLGEYHLDNPSEGDEELSDGGITIYPALYPLSKDKQAVALVHRWWTSYSGGGRDEEYADFVMINPDGSYKVAFTNIPFSSKTMIRACYSEEDYTKSAHCHDEDWRILSLKFIDTGKEYYSWKFINKSYSWPSFTEQSATKLKIDEYIEYPFQPAEKK